MTLVSAALVVSIAGVASVLAGRTLPRLDLTAGATAGLSPRTKQALAGLKGPTRIIIAGDLRSADPKARRALTDVLDELRASSSLLSVLTVDTTSETGLSDYRSVLESLRERESSQIESALAQAQRASATAGLAASELASAREPLAALRDAEAREAQTSPAMQPVLRGMLEQAPGVLATREKDLAGVGEAIAQPLAQRIVDVHVPALEQARSLLSAPALATAQDARTLLAEIAKINADPSTTAQARASLSRLASLLTRAADIAQSVHTQASALPRLDIARVAEALARGSAGLIVGPPVDAGNASAGASPSSSLVAIDLRSLLPDGVVLEAAQASRTDLQRRVEDVLSTSLASLQTGLKPLLIITHTDPPGAVLGTRLFDAAVERLALRGIDTLEWSAVAEDEPRAKELDPSGTRPRVYLAIAPDASSQANATGLTGSQRVQQLATRLREATRSPEAQGPRGLLLSLAPSILPTYGSPDPLAQLAEDFGIRVQSATPLLTEVLTPQGRSVETDRIVQPIEGEAAVQLAMRGLPTYVTWALPMEVVPNSDAMVVPLLGVPAGQTSGAGVRTWAESQWQRLRGVRREDRALLPQNQQPAPDAQREQLAPPAFANAPGQWVVAAASEKASQRIVVVGSNDWAIDPVTQQGRVVDGRPVLQSPGNLELLDASVHWLAKQDALIAQSASATVAPMVRAIDDSALRSVRIATIAGLPVLVLVTGLVVRLLRKDRG
jgi:hypothetical protein